MITSYEKRALREKPSRCKKTCLVRDALSGGVINYGVACTPAPSSADRCKVLHSCRSVLAPLGNHRSRSIFGRHPSRAGCPRPARRYCTPDAPYLSHLELTSGLDVNKLVELDGEALQSEVACTMQPTEKDAVQYGFCFRNRRTAPSPPSVITCSLSLFPGVFRACLRC